MNCHTVAFAISHLDLTSQHYATKSIGYTDTMFKKVKVGITCGQNEVRRSEFHKQHFRVATLRSHAGLAFSPIGIPLELNRRKCEMLFCFGKMLLTAWSSSAAFGCVIMKYAVLIE